MPDKISSFTSRFDSSFLDKLRGNIVVITPPAAESVKDSGSWGESGPDSWMEMGPAWVNSEQEMWREREVLEFGGNLTPEILEFLSKNNSDILEGSKRLKKWRISVPEDSFDRVRKFLISSKVEYIKKMEIK